MHDRLQKHETLDVKSWELQQYSDVTVYKPPHCRTPRTRCALQYYSNQTKDMTATATRQDFSDFCAQRDAQNTIQLNVVKWTYMLCDALRQNYIDYSIKSHKRNRLQMSLAGASSSVDYHDACIKDLENGNCDYDFTFESGRKYHKIIMSAAGARSVHAFVDKKTGEVYKSASWKSPAKGVRYDMRIIEQREWLLQHADWSGRYLYAK